MKISKNNNAPELWVSLFPRPKASDHKYMRGQVIVLGGDEMTGAACLSADSAARIGAGLVTIIAQKRNLAHRFSANKLDPLFIYKNFRPYIIARRLPNLSSYIDQAQGKGCVASVIGPGLGNNAYKQHRRLILDILNKGENLPVVIDADGLNAFEEKQTTSTKLCKAMHINAVLTPHDGEFKKIFPQLADTLKQDRLDTAAQAAKLLSGGVLVLKGNKTIIAQQLRGDVQILENKTASPYLASAGSGDVLSGMIAGLMAQGMPAFQAAAASVWMHGKIAQDLGSGLVAGDLIENIPKVLKEMLGI